MPPIRVLVADDHPVYREGVARAIAERPDLELVGEAGDGREALTSIRRLQPDVAVLDVRMPGLTGVAQIYAPRDVPRRQKFRYDRLYVRRQSFALDLRLMALSFWITFRGSWESRGRKF